MENEKKRLSVVVSVYNEEKALERFYQETKKVLDSLSWDWELLFVNDGSADGSKEVLERLAGQENRIKVISFSRNFGHESAMIAGIDYSTGDSWEETEDFSAQESPELSAGTEETFSSSEQETFTDKSAAEATYILNVNTGKFHRPDCHSVNQMKEKNKMEMTGTRDELVQQGYSPCQNCNP